MTPLDSSLDSTKEKEVEAVISSQADSEENVNIETEKILEGHRETTFITGLPLSLTLASTGLAQLLVSLDRTIVATAIPTITDEFHSINDISWYATAYMITSFFLLAFGMFEVGSAICGSAPNSIGLIIGRAIAGIGASGVSSGTMMILVHISPLHKRPLYAAIMAAAVGVASILRPVLGGLFTTHLSWRGCFYINLPIGAFTMPIIAFCLKTPKSTTKKVTLLEQFKKLDPLGILCFIPSVVCLVLALQWGVTTYPWNDERVIACVVFFAGFIVAFALVQVWLATWQLSLLESSSNEASHPVPG